MKKISLNEHINAMKNRINYMNETPSYRKFGDEDTYDDIPVGIFEAGEEDLPPEQLNVPTKGAENTTGAEAEMPPAPAMPPAGGEMPPQPDAGAPALEAPIPDLNPDPLQPLGDQMPVEPPQPDVDSIQNDIIKSNLMAIRDIHDQLKTLNSIADSLNSKMDVMAKDVDEVREPTNGEKLMNKSKVSYPFYQNLSDMWKGNWFDKSREGSEEKGINKLPDGSYIADFDDLAKMSPIDVQKSF